MKLRVAGQLLDRYSRVRDRIDQFVEVDLLDLCQRLGRALADLFHVGWDGRNLGVGSGARLDKEVSGLVGMKAEIDVKQAGQEALHVQLRPHRLLDQVLEFLGLERLSGGPFAFEFLLVELEDHRQRHLRVAYLPQYPLAWSQPQADFLDRADLNAFDLDRGADLQT